MTGEIRGIRGESSIKAAEDGTLADVTIKTGERVDDLQRNGLQIIQDKSEFCFGIDAVLLSGFASVKPGEKVIDLGTGNGILPLLLSAKTEASHITGLEIDEKTAEMASRSVRLNGLEERITIDCGDIRSASERYGASSFDVVVSNPPYMTKGHGLVNPDSRKAVARHEVKCTLEELIRETTKLLVSNGRCYFVHRPFRLVDLFALMRKYKIEPKTMRLVYPFSDSEPNMILVEGIRNSKSRLKVLPPLIVYESEGVYTKEIRDIYSF
ncbi:MAG: tRNA1(Val) (adenine(37)-N6)-methyltransferase [Lachnospiraceae bacterium]|nr:tRNA1(Val) (adenine(37)-N6)-methyltransferase [Lachnospiraceae bacterium]